MTTTPKRKRGGWGHNNKPASGILMMLCNGQARLAYQLANSVGME